MYSSTLTTKEYYNTSKNKKRKQVAHQDAIPLSNIYGKKSFIRTRENMK